MLAYLNAHYRFICRLLVIGTSQIEIFSKTSPTVSNSSPKMSEKIVHLIITGVIIVLFCLFLYLLFELVEGILSSALSATENLFWGSLGKFPFF